MFNFSGCWDGRSLVLKKRSRQFRLSDDTEQCTATHLVVHRNGNRNRGGLQSQLHDPVAASLPDIRESILFENTANLQAR